MGGGNLGNRAQSISVAPPKMASSRGAISATGRGANRLYAITSLQEKESSQDVVIGMINILTLDFYVMLDPGTSLSFVIVNVANQFEILLEKFCEPFYVSTPIEESILAERVYCGCLIYIYHKNTMANIVELDMVNFYVILSIDWLHACYPSTDCRIRVIKFQIPNELFIVVQ